MIDPIYNRPIHAAKNFPEVVYCVTSSLQILPGFYWRKEDAIRAALESGGCITKLRPFGQDEPMYREGANPNG